MAIKTSMLLRPVALAALFLVTNASHAAITVYTSLVSFSAAISAAGTDTFTGLSTVASTPTPVVRTTDVGAAYSYTVDAGPAGSLYGAGTTAGPFLSTNAYNDTLTLSSFASGIVGVGANFFGTNIDGAYTLGGITVTATDASGTVTQTITAAVQNSFLGFVSSTGMTNMTIVGVQTGGAFLWPTVDNLAMGKSVTAPIPEPSTYALMLAGLATLGFAARRRKA